MREEVGDCIRVHHFDKMYVRLNAVVEAVKVDEVHGLCRLCVFKAGHLKGP